MPLTPIPLTDNWFDTYGSQVAPIAQAAKTAPIVIAAAASVGAGNVVTINRTHALGMEIDWADGSPVEAHAAGGGVKTHDYKGRLGSYRIRSRVVTQPDVLIDEVVRIANRLAPTVTIVVHPTEPNGIKLDIANAYWPVSIQWGDGDSRYEQYDTGSIFHTYDAPGSYVVQVNNGAGKMELFPITIPLAVEDPTPQFSPPYPWLQMGVQALNDFVEEHDLEVPPAWFQWTLPAKKAFLATTYGEG